MTEIACLDISSMTAEDYQRLFSQASRKRQEKAARCLRQEDKNRCVAADALLRYAVKKRLGVSQFEVDGDVNGKPYLPAYPDFHYNLSHSGDYVVIGFGDCPLGVDIQQMDSHRDCAHLARRHYTPQEENYVFDEDGNCRIDRFYQVWTAKESYLKYLGIGLRRSLNSFCVTEPLPNVQLDTTFIQDHCLTLCTEQGGLHITHLNITDL